MASPAKTGPITICTLRQPVDLSTASANLSSGWILCKDLASLTFAIWSCLLLNATHPAHLFGLIGRFIRTAAVTPVVTFELLVTPSSLARKSQTHAELRTSQAAKHQVLMPSSKLTACNNLASEVSSCWHRPAQFCIVNDVINCLNDANIEKLRVESRARAQKPKAKALQPCEPNDGGHKLVLLRSSMK